MNTNTSTTITISSDNKKLVEKEFAKVTEMLRLRDYSDAPFGFECETCRVWMESKQSTLQWILEVIL